MNHSCENTSLQNVSVENLQFLCVFFRLSCKNIQMSADLSKKLFNNSNIIEVKAWQLDT